MIQGLERVAPTNLQRHLIVISRKYVADGTANIQVSLKNNLMISIKQRAQLYTSPNESPCSKLTNEGIDYPGPLLPYCRRRSSWCAFPIADTPRKMAEYWSSSAE